MKKCCVMCSHGIGDGLIFLLISHNLKKNGYEVDTYHDSLGELKPWINDLNVFSYPKEEEIPSVIEKYDLIIINADHLPKNVLAAKHAKKINPENTYILMPTSRKRKYFLGDFSFNRNITMVNNLYNFCKTDLKLEIVEKKNGFLPKPNLIYRKELKRVIIHPASKSGKKNWPKKNFVKIALWLKKKNYEPVFIMTEKEKTEWNFLKDFGLTVSCTNTLDELAELIYESAFFIGNDSGIGHLASSLKIPLLSIIQSKRKKDLWKPDFSKGKTITPWPILPHIKGFRMREKYWMHFIEPWRVKRKFKQLVKEYE